MQSRIAISEPLKALGEEDFLFVGRKASVYSQHSTRAAMDIGVVAERTDSQVQKKILMDSISPHAVFICGMRGSGKSYTLGVIAEELALKNDAVGAIVIDPMGIFWSMKKGNQVEREQDLLAEWGLEPTGVDRMRIFIPAGYAHEAPGETWDAIFAIRPCELTADDWCLTFGFDRFDTMGLLLDRVIEKTKEGYTTVEGGRVAGVQEGYAIQDMIRCIESEEGVHSRKQGFKNSTRRALVARLKGAEDWGIFDKEGTQLRDLSRRGQISVIDVSFLQDNVRALIVGILARNILNTRKLTSRKEAVGLSGLFQTIPVTWLMIDEAHILVPGSGRKTAATDALIEYVRQGRQPGCSIVLATQQPSAIDSRILSQVDMVVCHKLVYEDDIKAVLRRMPSEVPERFQEDHFIKSLPIGVAIIGDKQEETSRCFLARIRPRISQHEGRERQPLLEVDPQAMRENVKNVILERWGKETTAGLKKLIESVNEEYKLNLSLSELLDELAEEGALEELEKESESKREPEPEKKLEKERESESGKDKKGEDTELESKRSVKSNLIESGGGLWEVARPALEITPPPSPVSSADAVETPSSLKDIKLKKAKVVKCTVERKISDIAEKYARRLLIKRDNVEAIFKVYYPLYQVFFDFYPPNGKYKSLSCFVDGITGEVLLKKGKRTRGVRDLAGLTPDQRRVLLFIMKKKSALQMNIIKGTHFDKRKVKRITSALIQKGLLKVKKYKEFENKKFEVLQPTITYDIAEDPRKNIVYFLETDEEYIDDESVISPVLKKKEAKKAAEIWERSEVWDTDMLFYPYFIISYESRYEIVDGVTGKKDNYIKSMLTFRL